MQEKRCNGDILKQKINFFKVLKTTSCFLCCGFRLSYIFIYNNRIH